MHVTLRQHIDCFIRNKRWGTCGECPRHDGEVWPEKCPNTPRYDHQLTIEGLMSQIARANSPVNEQF